MLRAIVVVALFTSVARADDDLAARTIIYARGTTLYKADARGKGEAELATLAARAQVRALRTDALGKVLLADIGGVWSWMPLDGSTKTLTELPCDVGPAQLAEDGLCVLCRKKNASVIVNLAKNTVTPVDVAASGARLAGMGAERKLIWADDKGIWSASPSKPKAATKVAPEPPVRGLAPSPDGTHALGIYKGEVFENAKSKKPGEILMVFALDGEAARRKAIQGGVPIEWSHDSKWVLLQDGASACVMLAVGGQYKCWKGYTAAAIAPDGKYALLLGNRKTEEDNDKKSKKSKKDKSKKKKKEPEPEPVEEAIEDMGGEGPIDDVPVALPTGPLALYRAELEGAFTKSPAMVVRVVDGAAVFVP